MISQVQSWANIRYDSFLNDALFTSSTNVNSLNKRSSSSSYICHGVGPLVDPFRSHVSRRSGVTVSPGMEEMPSLNLPVQRLKVAILPLDLPCSGPVTH
jgi:hypothetical protein